MAGSHKAAKVSVSPLQGKMKRSWRDKLDPEGVELLDDYRQLGGMTTLEEFDEWVEAVGMPRELDGLPSLVPNRILVTMQMLELQRTIPKIWQPPKDQGEDFFEKLELKAFRGTFTRLFETLQKMEFGASPVEETQRQALAAQLFRLCEQLCRGEILPPKGTQNLERADLVNFIREHEKARLSWEELRDALLYAGANVAEDPEALRLWVWRAEREGLVRPRGKTKRKGAEGGGKERP